MASRMTAAAIKAMFRTGGVWHGVRTDKRLSEEHERRVTATRRTVLRMRSKDIVWAIGASGQDYYMPLPKASEVVEARPGFLHFTILDGNIDVQLTKEA